MKRRKEKKAGRGGGREGRGAQMAHAFKLWDGQGWYCLGGDGWHPPSLFHLYPSLCADVLLHPHVSTSGGTLAIGRFGLTNHRLRTKEGKLLSRTPVRKISGRSRIFAGQPSKRDMLWASLGWGEVWEWLPPPESHALSRGGAGPWEMQVESRAKKIPVLSRPGGCGS